MCRTGITLSLGFALLLLARAWTAPVEGAKDTKKVDPGPKAKAEEGPAAALARRANFPDLDDPKITLSDALKFLSDRSDVNFEVNETAFKFEQLMDVDKVEIASPKAIPGLKNGRLDTMLSRVLARIPVPSGATYVLRRDSIEITTNKALQTEIWGEGYTGPFLPLVHVRIDKRPLDEALGQLADHAQFNVVIDKRVGDKANTVVSARFTNTPLDTAVRLLAEMAELNVVHRDNVLFVTTSDYAAKLDREFDRDRPRPPEMGGFFSALGGGWSLVPAGLAQMEESVPAYRWRKGAGQPVLPRNADPVGGM